MAPACCDPSRNHRVSREAATGFIQAFQTQGIRTHRTRHPDASPTLVLVVVDREGAGSRP